MRRKDTGRVNSRAVAIEVITQVLAAHHDVEPREGVEPSTSRLQGGSSGR